MKILTVYMSYPLRMSTGAWLRHCELGSQMRRLPDWSRQEERSTLGDLPKVLTAGPWPNGTSGMCELRNAVCCNDFGFSMRQAYYTVIPLRMFRRDANSKAKQQV